MAMIFNMNSKCDYFPFFGKKKAREAKEWARGRHDEKYDISMYIAMKTTYISLLTVD